MAQRSFWTSYIVWGSIAVCAVLASAVTIALVVGKHRGIEFASSDKRPSVAAPAERAAAPGAQPEPAIFRTPDVRNREIARLNDALRTLAAERDRLEERLMRLEENLGDITASVGSRSNASRIPAADPDGPPSEPGKSPHRITASSAHLPAPGAQANIPPAGVIASIGGGGAFLPYMTSRPVVLPPSGAQEPVQIHAVPLSRGAVARVGAGGSSASRTEFAVDLGAEPNMDALRVRWATLRTTHAPVLGTLRPLASVRESNRPGSIELRLVAGPFADAGEAARVCASLETRGVSCQTTVFDGQRLPPR